MGLITHSHISHNQSNWGITIVSYSVLINGEPKGKIIPSRGLRQGDPISPYLFLLCAKGLLTMFKNEEGGGHLKGIAVSRRASSITHMLFANDLGQQLNKEKTFLYFTRTLAGK